MSGGGEDGAGEWMVMPSSEVMTVAMEAVAVVIMDAESEAPVLDTSVRAAG